MKAKHGGGFELKACAPRARQVQCEWSDVLVVWLRGIYEMYSSQYHYQIKMAKLWLERSGRWDHRGPLKPQDPVHNIGHSSCENRSSTSCVAHANNVNGWRAISSMDMVVEVI